MKKEHDSDPKDKKAEMKEADAIEVQKGPRYSGDGFIKTQDLIDNIKAWQQREELSEDVDYLERKGGILELIKAWLGFTES